jgi:tRNA-2-methylthio-N6-dimethylallyladenosine synthase
MSKKIYIETFGCQMNFHDSDRMKRLLLADSFEITENEKEADAAILNTCSIRDKAEKKVLSRIGRLRRLKKKNPDFVIGISGCMAQRLGKKLMEEAKGVDFVFGTHVIPSVAYLVNKSLKGEKVVDTAEKGIDGFEFARIPAEGATVVEGNTALVSIMNGCDNYCSYCVVPYVRGREISRNPEEIISEIKALVNKGAKEVTLLGQNVNSYATKTDFGLDFCDLLVRINDIKGLERLRFVTSHPKDLSDKLVGLFGKLPKLCEHIHLPVQSGSSKILKLMNRKYTAKEYKNLITKLRERCPEIAITTDIIVAYPGETDMDFKETMELAEWVGFDGAFSFRFSPRPGTEAAKLKNMVKPEVAQKRLSILQEMQKKMTFAKNKEMLDKVCEVLVEGKSKRGGNQYFGRTRTNKIVNFVSGCDIRGMVKLKITKAHMNSLSGELL